VLLLTGAIMAVGIWLPFSGFAPALQMVPLPGAYFPWLFAILLTYCLLTQVVKVWFIQKFHRWL
jgi:Mg2+-importing ATPase